ncbi:hypothetical protein [Georgenia faecalis]|uniref:Uncharacterized protein n=1 Tax=Georgenia faecalis TaxID=2483799 RepID=A0ABV9DCQ8_9MICO|nr:hypothetical protein [Georgenia faecalis]
MSTVEDLRARLAEAGLDPDDVGRAEDRSLPRIDGVLLLRTTETGVRVSTWERGQEHFPLDFASEAEAVDYLAPRLLARRSVWSRTEDEANESRRRMQEKARRALARFDAPTTEDE